MLLLPALSSHAGPLSMSGDVGYSFRSHQGSPNGDTTSNQMRTSLNGRAILGQDWLANLDFGLRLTGDTTTYADVNGGGRQNVSAIMTGDVGLSLLPKSRTPLRISLRRNDSRVDSYIRHDPLNALATSEFSSQRLAVKQSFLTEKGNRFQLRYDNNNWSSATASYDDVLYGADMNIRLPKQTLTAKTSVQNTDYSTLEQKSTNTVLNVDHYYYPSRALRIDSMASLYGYNRTSNQPLNSTNLPDSETDLSQYSSFIFWRPENKPVSISGGVRLYDLSGFSGSNTVAVNSVNANSGLLYQYSKNARFDARLDVMSNDSEGVQVMTTQQRLGVLVQSDLHRFFTSQASYQWHMQGSVAQRDSGTEQDMTNTVRLGHDVQKSWRSDEYSGWRMSLSQTANASQVESNVADERQTQRFDHTFSIARDVRKGTGYAMLQFTLADSRSTGDQENEQQFVNFQWLRNIALSRRSSLTGNMTAQAVRRVFNPDQESDTVTTATGQINYQHSRMMGVPRLRFASDFRASLAATEEGVDRLEWENRLDYAIGLLDTRASIRMIDLNGTAFNLLYFQATRRF